jgi:hypothetical protein
MEAVCLTQKLFRRHQSSLKIRLQSLQEVIWPLMAYRTKLYFTQQLDNDKIKTKAEMLANTVEKIPFQLKERVCQLFM